MNQKISIIIPVYNSEKYLSSCLESILSQSFVDWELILINDGSNDDSGKICDEYSKKDPRIKVIHQKNQGVSSARNRGLEIAQGDWIYFCDSDDELFVDSLQSLLDGTENNVSMVMGGFTEIDGYSENIKCSRNQGKIQLNADRALKELFEPSDKIYKGYLWTKLFRRDIIIENGLIFDKDIIYNEDRLFIVRYLSNINGTVNYIPANVYRYFKRKTGAMSNVKSDAFETDLDAFLKIIDVIDRREDEYLSKLVRRWTVFSWYINRRIKGQEKMISKRKRLLRKVRSRVNNNQLISGIILSLKISIYSKLSNMKHKIIAKG